MGHKTNKHSCGQISLAKSYWEDFKNCIPIGILDQYLFNQYSLYNSYEKLHKMKMIYPTRNHLETRRCLLILDLTVLLFTIYFLFTEQTYCKFKSKILCCLPHSIVKYLEYELAEDGAHSTYAETIQYYLTNHGPRCFVNNGWMWDWSLEISMDLTI
jgi:hypothetical protein